MKMKKPRIIRDKRGDISSPIILVLITVAAIAVAGIAISWMFSMSSRVTTTGALTVIGNPTVTSGSSTTNYLYITVKNLGSTQLSITSVRLHTYSTTTSQNIDPGSTVALTFTFASSTFSPGQSYSGVLITSAGSVPFTALCQ